MAGSSRPGAALFSALLNRYLRRHFYPVHPSRFSAPDISGSMGLIASAWRWARKSNYCTSWKRMCNCGPHCDTSFNKIGQVAWLNEWIFRLTFVHNAKLGQEMMVHEMNEITRLSSHKIRNESLGGLRQNMLLPVTEVPHGIKVHSHSHE